MVGCRFPGFRGSHRGFPSTPILACVGLLAAGVPALAQEDVPYGVVLGKWLVRPSLVSSYNYATNPFYQSDSADPVSERIIVVTPRVEAILPFSNSHLALDYEITKLDYELSGDELPKDTVETYGGELSFLFSSFDRIAIDYHRTDGLARSVLYDQGGEAVFDGSTFVRDGFALSASREVYGRRGYVLALERSSVRFDEGTTVRFFDYDGWDLLAEYREPLSPVRWLTFSVVGRDYDHYEVNQPQDDPFRREETLAVYAGLMERIGARRNYMVRIGYQRSDFPGSEASGYRGVVANGYLYLGLGARTQIIANLNREVYPSFFQGNNAYVANQLQFRMERNFGMRVAAGASAGFAINEYGEPTPSILDPTVEILREDRLSDVEVYANLVVSDRFGFRLAVRRQKRASNYPFADYEALTAFAGVSLGWI